MVDVGLANESSIVYCGPLGMRFERKAFAVTDIIHISKASNSITVEHRFGQDSKIPTQ